MQLVDRKKKSLKADESMKSPIPRVTLASIESLSIPLVQEVVFLADYRCSKCQQRVAEVMSKMNGETESVLISVLEKKVTLTYKYSQVSDGRVDSIRWNPFNRFAFLMRKMRRIILRMKEIEMHLIEKQQNRVSIVGRFDPADIAIRIRKKMNRRVEILDIQVPGNGDGQAEEIPHAPDGPGQTIMQQA